MTEKRLNKFISESGVCSRREADQFISDGKVRVNGRLPELGCKVSASDQVTLHGKLIRPSAQDKTDRVYLAYHKPIGITCTTERQVKGNIVQAINYPKRIFPIGRLDKPSEGLILLTSDGDIVNKILRAENAHDKEYQVKVDKPIHPRFVQRMSQGIPILGTVTKPCKVEQVGSHSFKIVLTQGLNRQIRRMCSYLGYEVVSLKRTRIMHIDLTGLAKGQWRALSAKELSKLNQAVAGSSKEAAVGIKSGEPAQSRGKSAKRHKSSKQRAADGAATPAPASPKARQRSSNRR